MSIKEEVYEMHPEVEKFADWLEQYLDLAPTQHAEIVDKLEVMRKETKQKMIEEFKEMIDRCADKWQKVNTDLCEKKVISVVAESRQRNWIQTFCRELKSQVEKGE